MGRGKPTYVSSFVGAAAAASSRGTHLLPLHEHVRQAPASGHALVRRLCGKKAATPCLLLAASVATPLCHNHERAAISHHRNQTMTLQSQYCTRCGMVGHEASDCPMLPKARRRKPRPIFLPCDRCAAQLHHILANSCMYRTLSFSCARMTGLRRLAHPAYPPCALWSQAAPRGVVLPRTNCASSVDFACGDFKPCLQHGVIGCPTHT